jgi:hypothetical protein
MNTAISDTAYPPHPLAAMFPRPTPEEQRELTDHIRQHGLQEPMVLFQGKVLDGLSRQEACAHAGRESRYVKFTDLSPAIRAAGPLEFVIGKNLVRRHYTTIQRAMIAAELIPAFEKEALERRNANLKHVSASAPAPLSKAQVGTNNGEIVRGKSAERAAKMLGVSTRIVESARRILKKSPEKAAAIKAGTLTVGEASMDQAASQKMAALEAAHTRIEKVCGKELADAARNKTRLRTAREALAFSSQGDREMRSQAGLIELGWPLRKAQKFKAKNLTKRSTLEDLFNRAASYGFSLRVVIDGWEVNVVRVNSALRCSPTEQNQKQ